MVVGYYSCGLLIALVGMAVGVWLVLLRFGLAVVLLFAAGVGFLLLGLGLLFRLMFGLLNSVGHLWVFYDVVIICVFFGLVV